MKTRSVKYEDGSTTLVGYLAYDDRVSTRRAGLVLVPEIWGLGANARQRAERLAGLGYAVLAADPYGNGIQFDDIQEARKLATPLREDIAAVRRRVRVALDALAQQPTVDPQRLGAIGYCMGGSFALELARSGAPVRGVVALHAGLVTKRPAEPGHVSAQILVCTGADDPHVPWDQVSAFAAEMRAAGVDYQINVYGGAKHGFAIPEADSRNLPGLGYSATADARSWAAMVAFLEESLGAA